MATLNDRPFSKDYSGLINQSVIAGTLITICLVGPAIAQRKRRGKRKTEGLGSVESWEFGYLYQGRSWAKDASPPLPLRWPLQWISEAFWFSELKLLELRGLDAAVYSRWLRGCGWFTLIQSLTTVPILLPIHVHFAGPDDSLESMTRASISALVETATGKSLLWVHCVLLFWITITWVATLAWISVGAFKYRAIQIERFAQQRAAEAQGESSSQYHPHPQSQHQFLTLPSLDKDKSNHGIRLRTVMVTNIPLSLRSEKDLEDYFQYYLSRPVSKPLPVPLPIIDSMPGLANKLRGLLMPKPKTSAKLPDHPDRHHSRDNSLTDEDQVQTDLKDGELVKIERVVIARKMTELASLLERREDVLRKLEMAHINLAKRVLDAVRLEMLRREGRLTLPQRILHHRSNSEDSDADAEMDILVRELSPFVDEFSLLDDARTEGSSWVFWRQKAGTWINLPEAGEKRTIWDALLGLPRGVLDQYQPLTHLSVLFRGKTVPAIDYYTAKLGLLTSLIAENRAKPESEYDPVSTAFVTFKYPKDALKACDVLAVHPNNMLMCKVSMAPDYEDLSWVRVMKSTYRAEFVKDWVVGIGVWGFTIFWLFPLSLFVGLISIQNIAAYWPKLFNYLTRHPWEEEVIQSFVPTLIVALLTLLIPLILLLIAKKAHTILTLSELHDRIMTRYYKFLIVNILVFFCVGTAALQSLLLSFSAQAHSSSNIIQIVASSFPSAGPFYVGWMIFTTGMHSALEVALFGLPLFSYFFTRRYVVPRQRAIGIRPRTFNYYYWLPNHLLVLEVIIVFSVLNPLVIPFGCVYFFIDSVVIKNQFVHVYAKVYENKGKVILIRLVRYSLDGVVLLQVVFLAYMAVLKVKVNVALSGVLIVITVLTKLAITRIIRAKFHRDDLLEAEAICGTGASDDQPPEPAVESVLQDYDRGPTLPSASRLWRTWKNLSFSYGIHSGRPHRGTNKRKKNPFPRPQSMFDMRRDDIDSPIQSPHEYKDSDHIMRPSAHEKISEVPISRPRSPPPQVEKSPTIERKRSLMDWQQSQAEQKHTPLPLRMPTETVLGPPTGARQLVVPHPPVPTWDDDPHPDRPYDNPYYSAPIGSSLWLPRNPCGLLDLDDTVDVHMSLTTVEAAGELGLWQAPSVPNDAPLTPFPITASPEEELPSSPSIAPSSMLAPMPSPLLSSRRTLSGTETISLPPRIGSRVDDPAEFDRELQNRLPRQPSFLGRRSTARRSSVGATSYFSARSVSMNRHNTVDAEHGLSSFAGRAMVSSFSLAPGARKPRGLSMEEAVRPDMSAQAKLTLSSRHGVLPSATSYISQVSVVSAHEAVQAEVMVEEQEVAEARIREETERGIQSLRPRPWYERWAFSKFTE